MLFCDLVGSTAFAETVDTESAREAMGRYHTMARTTIEANGGTVAKFIGDGVMALFGVPEVAEDDAERAVLTGGALQRGFVRIREHIAERYGVEVGLRVGVNTGEVVIDDTDADLVGDVLNTAARLEAQCVPGEVLVGEDTWRLTRGSLGYRALREVSVKGKREGLATFELVVPDDVPDRDRPAVTRDDHAIPFVGREAEIDALHQVLDDAISARTARLATVIGAPGVGKTRLARECGRAVGDGARFVELRCERAGTATYAPIAELLQLVTGFDDDAPPEEIVDAIRRLVGGGDDADRLVELLGSFVGTAPPRSTEDAFFAVRRLVELLAGHRPLVLVIDDIQWAEPLFLDLLEHLAQWVKAAPVLMVGLARPELREIRPPLTETSRRVAAVISLEGLDARATELLAAELLGGASLPDELTARLPASTDGNPLFVRELVRMLVDDGVIVDAGDHWDLAIDAEAIEVPPTIQSLLATRVERLPHAERHVLELASVIGPEFPLGALAALLPDSGGDQLDSVIERLRRKEQVEPTGTYWGDEPVIRFHHVLIRDAAYRRLLKGARADLHLEVGAWMEATSEHLTGDFDVMIAHHFEQAYSYRRQLNHDDAGTAAAGQKAAALLHRAAEAAVQRNDLAAAAGYANRALATIPDEADEVPDLLLLACEAFLSSGDVGNGRAAQQQLAERAVGDDRLEAWAACFGAQLAVLTDPDGIRHASDAADGAAAQLRHIDDQAGVAKARIIRAQALARLGQVGAAEGELDLALTAARAAQDRRSITAVLSAAPVAALWGPSPVPRAGGRCLDVVRLSRITANSPEVEATSVRCQAVLEALRGRFDTARALLATARATTEEIGLRQGLLETRYFAGIVELLAGDPVAAEPHLRSAYGGLGQLGIGADAGQAAAYLARALLLQGRLDAADELAADSDALAGQNPQTAIAARSARAEILAVRGETVEALALAEEAVRLAEDTDIILDHANALATLARVRAAHGDRDGADRAAAAAGELFAQKGATILVETTRLPRGSGLSDETSTQPTSTNGRDRTAGRADDEPWNEADRLHRRLTQALETGDIGTWRQLIADEIRVDDRRGLLHHELASRSEIERFYDDWQQGAHDCTVVTLATRGDDLVLLDMRWTRADDPDGAALEHLQVNRWHDGRLTESVTFDPADLRAAIDELDRMFLATLDPITAGEYRHPFRFTKQLSDGRLEPVMAVQGADARMVDHRTLGWGNEQEVDELRERWRTLTEASGSITEFVRRFHHWSPQLICIAIRIVHESPEGAQFVDDHIVVSRTDPATGLSIRMDQFADHQLDDAMAFVETTMAEIEADVPRPNLAVRAGTVANVAALVGELDDLLDILSDDFTAELADGRIVTADDIRSRTVPPTGIGYGVDFHRVVSVIGDRLALLYVEVEGGERRFSIEESDEHGRLARIRQFPVTEMVAAVDHLEERWRTTGSPPAAVAAMNSWERAARAFDADAVDRLTADDFQLVDHRALGLGRLDRDEVTAASSERPTPTPHRSAAGELGVLTPVFVHHVSDTVNVVRSAMFALGDAGDLWEALVSVTVYAHRNGLTTHIELFDGNDLDAALARARELEPQQAVENPEVHDPWNHADHLNRLATDHFFSGRIDEWAAMFDDDYRGEDRRPLLGHHFVSKEELEAANRTLPVASLSADLETLSCRGDHLVLTRITISEVDDGSAANDVLDLTEWNDHGRCIRTVTFDPEAIDDAIGELDRLERATVDPPVALMLERNQISNQAIARIDLDTLEKGQHPELVFVDHRPIGFGTTTGHAGPRERVASLAGSGDRLSRYDCVHHRITPFVLCSSVRNRVTETNGAETTDDHILVFDFDVASGLIRRIEQYGPDDLDAALERADALHALHDADVPPNLAAAVGADLNWSARVGLHNRFAARLADDVEARGLDDRNGLLTKADIETGRAAPIDLGFGSTAREVIATRGDRLALVRVQTSLEAEAAHRWSVEEVDESGRLVRITQFEPDDLLGAVNALDARSPQLDDHPPMPAAIWSWHEAHRKLDLETLQQLTAGDFEMVDHRPRGYEPADRSGAMAVLLTGVDDEALRGVAVNDSIHAAGDRWCVYSGSMWMQRDDGDYWTGDPFVGVIACRGPHVVSIGLFGKDQLDDALEYARRRWSEQGAASTATARVDTIDHRELIERFGAAIADANIGALEEMLGPGFHTDDQRPLGWGPRDRSEFLESVRQRPATLGTGTLTWTAELQHGDVVAGTYEVVTTPEGRADHVIEAGANVALVENGKISWLALYPLDQLDEAITVARQLAAERRPPVS